MNNLLTNKQINRYLRILGVRNRTPGFYALSELVKAHVIKIPFENISKLYYLNHMNLRGMPEIDQYLEGIEKYNFGGTCYSNNYYLYLLLKSLGYDIKLCSADMSKPDVHMVSIVKLEGREYLVDSGNAAPFLNPLPRDITSDYSIASGNNLYILKPQDAGGKSQMELYRDGEHVHNYIAKPEPKSIVDFSKVISDSFKPDATFMNAVLLTRFFTNSSIIIHNYTIIESEGTSYNKYKLTNIEELVKAIENHFSIPAEITKIALSGVTQLKDVWA